ncbi:MAG TPA: hypothetical protein VMB05_01120, partial [Solirubrobacteraceae bacterium]|nr:hypothetical protein [Solirubrobacteraceae bacterium]
MPKHQTRARVAFAATIALFSLFVVSSVAAAASWHPASGHAASRVRSALSSTQAQPAVLLGDRTVEPQTDSLPSGRAAAFRFRALSSGYARSIYLYIGSTNAAGSFTVGIYRDSHGHPGTLMVSGSGAVSAAGSWSTVPIARTGLLSGVTYWVAVLGRGGTLRYRDRLRGSCSSEASVQLLLSTLPASWRTASVGASCPLSAYVTTGVSSPVAPPAPETPVSTEVPSGSTEAPPTGTSGSGKASSNPLEPVAPVEQPTLEPPVSPPVESPPAESPPVESPPVEPPPTEQPPSEPPPVEPPPPAPPVNTAAPSVSGLAVEAQTLSAAGGTWSGSPTSFAYQWQDCNLLGLACVDIQGATSTTYALLAADVGDTVRVKVTATNAGGSVSAYSVPTSAVIAALSAPLNLLAPSITGQTVEGQTLKSTTGTWTGNPTAFAYQWQDCSAQGTGCQNISGASSA